MPPELPPETPSGVHRAMKSEMNWQGAKMTVAMVVVAVSTAFGAYRVILGEALAQTDAGIKVEAAQREALQTRVRTTEKSVERLEDKVDRQSQKMDLVLDALRVPERLRPEPMPMRDGGR